MDFLTNLVEVVNNYLWNYVLLFLLVGTGVYFSVRLRFIQVRKLGAGLKHTFGGLTLHGEKADHEGMSSFQALTTAIAAQVGTGNITGCATALVSGGPGALFWVWVSAFFGMATIYAEAVLAQRYRTTVNSKVTGGPAYYIRAAFKGKLGKIRTVMAEYPQGWLAYEGEWGGKQGEWRCDPKQSGGVNCLGDLGTHVENAVSMLTGLKIKRVLAKMDVVVPGRVLDDNDVVLVEYEGGATGCYWTSQFAIGHDNDLRVRIYGENGSILWAQEECEKVTMIDRDGTIVERHRGGGGIEPAAAKYGRLPAGHGEGWLEAMGNLYRSFAQCVAAKADGTFTPDMIDYPTVSDGADGLAFVEACLESNRQGNVWVPINR